MNVGPPQSLAHEPLDLDQSTRFPAAGFGHGREPVEITKDFGAMAKMSAGQLAQDEGVGEDQSVVEQGLELRLSPAEVSNPD